MLSGELDAEVPPWVWQGGERPVAAAAALAKAAGLGPAELLTALIAAADVLAALRG